MTLSSFSSDAPPANPQLAELLGLGATALSVFLTEMALMRAVAQVTWPPFAFLALSAAMLGGGLAGTVLALKPKFCAREDGPARGALTVAISSPVAMFAALLGGLEPFEISTSAFTAMKFLVVLILLALPFVGLAWTLASMLEKYHQRAHAAYGADLVGASVGAFASVFVLNATGTAGAAYLACALGAGAALLLTPKKNAALQKSYVGLKGAGVGAFVLGIALLVFAPAIVPRATSGKRVGNRPAREVLAQLQAQGKLVTYDRADGRVDVIPAIPSPVILLDLGAAVARAPAPANSKHAAPTDAAAAGFVARSAKGGRTLVLGSGAGYEVSRALAHGASHVDAVEFSGAVLKSATSGVIPSSAAVFADPRVRVYHDEARSFLERQKERWRHIVAVHTISNTAVATSAMQLAEDFLLTVESFEALVGHLTDDGVLYVTRPRAQMPLLADVARAALISTGVAAADVDRHIVLVEPIKEDAFFRGLLVFRSPTEDDFLATATTPRGLRYAPAPKATGHALPTDARPFFHRLSDQVDSNARARLQIEGPKLAERAVLWVGALSLLAALLAIGVPLWARRGPNALPRPSSIHIGIAALLGVGFMVLELALAQRLTLICGTPATAFAAVVGGMLLGGGATGLIFSRNAPSLRVALFWASLGCLVALALPPVLRGIGALALPELFRAVLVAIGAAICAAPLGLVFPSLVQSAGLRAPGSAPWLFAVNASASVGAAALHAAVAPTIGLWGTTAVAGACYVIAFALSAADKVDTVVEIRPNLRLVSDGDSEAKRAEG